MNEEQRIWRKSSHSVNGTTCVEVALASDGSAAVRDSKAGECGPVLVFTTDEWVAFLAGVHDGQFGSIS